MSGNKKQNRLVATIKRRLAQATVEDLVSLRRNGNRAERIAAKGVLLRRFAPSEPIRHFELNHRPSPSVSQKEWDSWVKALLDYEQTEECIHYRRDLEASREYVRQLLNEEINTPQSGVRS